jgi:phosphoglycolate phosphatase
MDILDRHFEGKRHVIWDWNGTLLNDLEHALKSGNVLLKEEGLPQVSLEEYRKHFGFPVIEYYRRLGFDVSADNFRKLSHRFQELFAGGLGTCELWPGVREILARVKASGRMQSILSASEQGVLELSIKHFGIAEHFDHLTGIFNKEAAGKVDRGHELIKKAGVPPEETILIGDTDHDFEVAEALGIDVILVEHGHQTPERLRAVHHKVLKVL